MPDLQQPARRIGILDHLPPIVRGEAVSVRAIPPQARFVLRAGAADAARAGASVGLDLSQPINRAVEAQGRTAARLGPDEWLLLTAETDAEPLQTAIAIGFADAHHTLVDISHRNAAVEISGPMVPDVLNAGCPLDLGLDRFRPGDATRTPFGKIEIVLLRLDDHDGQPRYRVEFWRSFGRFVHAFIAEAAREYS